MMTNLFSVFDPSTSIPSMNLNWLSAFIGLIMFPSMFWLIPSRWHMMATNILMTLHLEFKTLLPSLEGSKSSSLMFISFSMTLFNNFMGLFPYVFSSHLTMTLSVALPNLTDAMNSILFYSVFPWFSIVIKAGLELSLTWFIFIFNHLSSSSENLKNCEKLVPMTSAVEIGHSQLYHNPKTLFTSWLSTKLEFRNL